jgi:phosphoribosyl-ATP pyrophosphohydrolase
MKTLKEMQAEVLEVNQANGWFEEDRTVGEDVALLHSEASEMLEAYRDHGLADFTTVTIGERTKVSDNARIHLEDMEAQGRLSDEGAEVLAAEGLAKPEGFGSEAADLLIRLLDTCERRGVDLDWEYARKISYNRTRGHRHGEKRL